MGRGGGRSGGGGFSRGGSRGFSSSRSSSRSSRGGGISFGGSSRNSSAGRSASPRPRRSGTVVRPTTVFVGSGNRGDTYYNDTPAPQKKKKGAVPGWYKFICIVMTIVALVSVFAAVTTSMAARDSVTREKLGADACVSTDKVMDDQLGWLTDQGTVKSGIRYFYHKTGVQPYLLICDSLGGKGGEITDEEAESYLEKLYNKLYEDEGHMIFVFMEYESSQYVTFVYTGRSADSVIDADARGIFLNNADQYYTDSSLSDEEYFEKIFRTSADAIMADASGSAKLARTFMIISVVILILLAGGLILFKSAEQKRREAEEMRRILETPVGGMGYSPEEEDLIHKYSEENQGGTN